MRLLLVLIGCIAALLFWAYNAGLELEREKSAYYFACARHGGYADIRAKGEWRCMKSLDTIAIKNDLM